MTPQRLLPVLLPGLLVALVLLLDVGIAADPPLLVLGLLDEPAHLATAGLALLALPARHRPGLRDAALVLAAAVLVDLDHVPLYLGVPHVQAAGGRPLTHSLVVVGALLLLGLRRRAWRLVAAGVALHLLRDAFTGPGLPLLWPADVVVLLPYVLYAGLLGLLAVAARAQASSPRRRR